MNRSVVMSFQQVLDHFVRARFTLIVVSTPEEQRVLEAIKEYCDAPGRPSAVEWDAGDGFKVLAGIKTALPSMFDPSGALDQIEKMNLDALFVLKDFHHWWDKPAVQRKLRNLAHRFVYHPNRSLVLVTHTTTLPEELKDEAVVADFPLPGQTELSRVLERIEKTPKIRSSLTELGREKLLQAALGLTSSQAQRAFARGVVAHGVLDDRAIATVTEQKRQIIRESKALEFYPAHETPDELAGLDVLKGWLRLRERAFTQEAREYGLPHPKGIALIGIPGTGKSLTAKTISGMWRLPLIRLDVGALFGSLVGESEERTRKALQLAETVSPCILWIDEIEKAFAHGGLDGGTSTRVFGTVLTWMQEKTAPCFVIATANDVAKLPPELLRKGRFDEIFFLDLPTEAERREILGVHLSKRNRIARDFDTELLAAESQGYVGAEIEQAVIDAMYSGFDQQREFTTEDVLSALKSQIPLSLSQREVIEFLRRWLSEGRARSASFETIKDSQDHFVPISV